MVQRKFGHGTLRAQLKMSFQDFKSTLVLFRETPPGHFGFADKRNPPSNSYNYLNEIIKIRHVLSTSLCLSADTRKGELMQIFGEGVRPDARCCRYTVNSHMMFN